MRQANSEPYRLEQDLVSQAQAGNREALERLVERYQDNVYSMAMKFTRNPDRAEDLAQEAWIRIVKGLGSFRSDSRFTTWLYQIVMNTFVSSTQKKNLEVEMSEEVERRLNDVADKGPEQEFEQFETRSVIQDALRSLPEEFRTVVALRYEGDLSYQDIAATIDVPLGTVQSRLKRGIDRLAKILRPHWEHKRV